MHIVGVGRGMANHQPPEALLGKYVQSAESHCEKQRQANSKGKREKTWIAYKLKVCGIGQDKLGMGKAGLPKATWQVHLKGADLLEAGTQGSKSLKR